MEWKLLGKGINVGKTSSPFSTQATMGGGGAGGGTHWGYKVPKSSTNKSPGEMYSGRSINRTLDRPGISKHIEPSYKVPKPVPTTQPASNRNSVVGKEFGTRQADLRAKDRKITVEQHQREENAAKMNRRMSQTGRRIIDEPPKGDVDKRFKDDADALRRMREFMKK